MAGTCLGCGVAPTTGLVCESCIRDPFMMEHARKNAAIAGDREVLRELYTPAYAYLHQGEVARLWEDVLSNDKDTIPQFTLWRNRMSADLVPKGAKKILEVGMGKGHGVREMVRRFPGSSIYGTDISENSVRTIASEFKGQFAVANLGHLPWNDIKFDVVLMLEVLEHVEVLQTFQVLSWLHSLLAPDGCLILSVPLEEVADLQRAYFTCPHCGKLAHQIGHVRSYSGLQPIRMELTISGFEIERMRGLAGGRFRGIPRQWLMHLFPDRVRPMVMLLRCRRSQR